MSSPLSSPNQPLVKLFYTVKSYCSRFLNPASAAIYVAINAVSLFITYKRLSSDLGIELFGTWSLFLTFNVSFGLFLTGFNGSVIKFLPEKILTESRLVFTFLTTSIWSVLLVTVTVLLLIYLFLSHFIVSIVASSLHFTLVFDAMPVIFSFILLTNISTVFLSILEGFNKSYVKHIILSVQALAIVIQVLAFNTPIKFLTTAWIFFVSSIFTFFLGIVCVVIVTRIRFCDILNFDIKSLRSTWNYHTHYFLGNVFGLLQEPINKLLIVHFVGAGAAGVYEMASKFVLQARTVLVSAILALVPKIAKMYIETPNQIPSYYTKLFRLNIYISTITFTILGFSLPQLSNIWFGHIDQMFINMGLVLVVGWYVNNLCLPAYAMNVATRGIQKNTIASLITIIMNLFVALLLNALNLGEYIIYAWVIAIAVGGLFLILVQRVDKQES